MAIELNGKSLVEASMNGKQLVEAWMNGHLVWTKGITDIKQMNPDKLFLWFNAPASQKSYRYDYMVDAMDSMIDTASYSITTNMVPSQLGVTKAFKTGTSVLPGATSTGLKSLLLVPEIGGYVKQMGLRSSVWSVSFAFFMSRTSDISAYNISDLIISLGDFKYGNMSFFGGVYDEPDFVNKYVLRFTNTSSGNSYSYIIPLTTPAETPYVLNDKGHGLNIVTLVKNKSNVKIFFNGIRQEGTIPGGSSTTVIDTVSSSAGMYDMLYNYRTGDVQYYADLAFYNRALTDLECYEIFKLYNGKNLPYIKFSNSVSTLNNVLFKFMIINESGEDLPLSFWSSMKVFQTSFGDYTVTDVDENGNYWGYATGNNNFNSRFDYLYKWIIPNNAKFEKFTFATTFNGVDKLHGTDIATGTGLTGVGMKQSSLRRDENLAVLKITSVTKNEAALPTTINIVFSSSTIQYQSDEWAQQTTLSMFMLINGDSTHTQVFFRTPLSSLMSRGAQSIDISNITSIEEIEFVLETPNSTNADYVFCVTNMPMPSINPDKILVKGYTMNYMTVVGGTRIQPCFDWAGLKGKVYPCVFMLGYRGHALGDEIYAVPITNECLIDINA